MSARARAHAALDTLRSAARRVTASTTTPADAVQAAAPDEPPAEPPAPRDEWFRSHFDQAADETLQFLAEEGIHLEGLQVADVGCGDGMTDLGLAVKGGPGRLVGYDVNLTDIEHLRTVAVREGAVDALPGTLVFESCEPDHLPAEDGTFDVVVSWSAFEHVAAPLTVAREVRRVLKEGGAFMLQLWPFYFSEYGPHLEEWYPGGFVHLERPHEELEQEILERTGHSDWAQYKLAEFNTLNRVTVGELQQALTDAGFAVTKVRTYAHTVRIPRGLSRRYALADLAIAGVQLLAIPNEA